jgi:hypothetical protein
MAVAIALACSASAASGQDVTAPSLKAAFIFSFAKFTDWPADVLPGTVPFVACVLGDAPVGAALDRTTKGRQLFGHSITVSQVTTDGPLRSCHLLYLSGVTAAQAAKILTVVRDLPVLTISDLDDFAGTGGIAHVFEESGKIRFDLNYELAKHSRLQLSSKLLSLANRVLDNTSGVER